MSVLHAENLKEGMAVITTCFSPYAVRWRHIKQDAHDERESLCFFFGFSSESPWKLLLKN